MLFEVSTKNCLVIVRSNSYKKAKAAGIWVMKNIYSLNVPSNEKVNIFPYSGKCFAPYRSKFCTDTEPHYTVSRKVKGN